MVTSRRPHLTVLSLMDVDKAIASVVGTLIQAGIDAVAYVPRGGAFPAALLANRLGVPLVTGLRQRSGLGRVLLVDDVTVTGRTFADAMRGREQQNLTFTLVDVAHARNYKWSPDFAALRAVPGSYTLLPWEFTDMFEETFPFQCAFELDGVLRDPHSRQPLWRTGQPISTVIAFERTAVRDRDWLGRAGFNVLNLQTFPSWNDGSLVSHLASIGVDVFVTSSLLRGREIKECLPHLSILLLPEFQELPASTY